MPRKKNTALQNANNKIKRLQEKLNGKAIVFAKQTEEIIDYSDKLYKSDKDLQDAMDIASEYLTSNRNLEKTVNNLEVANASLTEQNQRLNGAVDMADRNTVTLLDKMLQIQNELSMTNDALFPPKKDGE